MMKISQSYLVKIFSFLFLLLLLSFLFISCSQKTADKRQSLISNELDKIIKDDLYIEVRLGGYGFILFDENKEIWSSYGGYANKEKNIKFNGNTVFNIGELSTHFLIYSILKLSQEGKLNIDDDLLTYFADSIDLNSEENENLKKMASLSIISILNNMSGYTSPNPQSIENYDFNKDLVNYLQYLKQSIPEGEKQIESLMVMDILGLLIEKVTLKDFIEFMDKGVFNKLKMNNSTYDPQKTYKNQSLFYSQFDEVYKNQNVNILSPSVSARSTLKDLMKFYTRMLTSYNINQKNSNNIEVLKNARNIFLSKEYIDLLFDPVEQKLADENNSSMAFKLGDNNLSYEGKIALKWGYFLSQQSLVILLPDRGIGIVCTKNKYCRVINSIYDIAVKILQTYLKLMQ